MTVSGSPGASLSLDQVVTRFRLSPAQRKQLERVLAALTDDPLAPTTVTAPERALGAHVADSLVALELPGVDRALRVADIGSGAGFPGLVLAVALPAAHISLLESQGRRCDYLTRVLATAAITNADVVCRRAEAWPQGLGAHDLVTARAVGPAAVVLEYAAPLLRAGGALLDWRGRRDAGSERSARAVAASLGLDAREIRHVKPFPGAAHHHLHLYVKVGDTPSDLPRRPGMARKRPLRA